MARLEVENLYKRFGQVVAVDGVSFSVDAGEILVLLGPSGCGKTTVLRCIAGLERPDRGEIRLDGRSLLGLPPEKRDVGLVFQNYALFPHLTVAGKYCVRLASRKVSAFPPSPKEKSRRTFGFSRAFGLRAKETS
jgi:spermidine/putrescine transport system ATP-binding protein